MPLNHVIAIEAGQTYKLELYYPGTNLTGCVVRTQFRRTRDVAEHTHQFTSTPAAGWTIGQLATALVLDNGQTVPIGTWFASLRIEKSVTAAVERRATATTPERVAEAATELWWRFPTDL